MLLNELINKISRLVGFKIKIKDCIIVSDDIIDITLSINMNVDIKKLIKVLKLLDLIQFYVDHKYQHDIAFYNINIITFFNNVDNIDDVDDVDDINDLNIIIDDDFFNDIDIIDALNTIDDIDDIDDVDKNGVLKYIHNYKHYKVYDVNNKVIDTLSIDDINDIDDMNKKLLSFNKHMIKNMLLKREIKALNNLLDNYLTKRGHLRFKKHKKSVKIIKKAILDKYDTNNYKDEYNLKDYKILSVLNNYYHNTYNYDILKDEYGIDIKGAFKYNDVEYFKTSTSTKSYKYYINLLKK